jgi:hypothetical protein
MSIVGAGLAIMAAGVCADAMVLITTTTVATTAGLAGGVIVVGVMAAQDIVRAIRGTLEEHPSTLNVEEIDDGWLVVPNKND